MASIQAGLKFFTQMRWVTGHLVHSTLPVQMRITREVSYGLLALKMETQSNLPIGGPGNPTKLTTDSMLIRW